ncbi:MAG: CAP domain-containing protein [Bacteroidetes bacterium]|nr:CAP domain-containing protein [Bacteroidota bacterium]
MKKLLKVYGQLFFLVVIILLVSLFGTAMRPPEPPVVSSPAHTLPFSPEADFEDSDKTQVCLSPMEMELYELIMDYRRSKGLPRIPLSYSLTLVAQTHARDVVTYRPDQEPCNSHSWSSKGDTWKGCCYTRDHKQAQCMWDKPKEITAGKFTGYGFEISYGGGNPSYGDVRSASAALDAWKKSSGHNTVIVNEGIWKDNQWKSIGIGIYKGSACVWFSDSADPQGAAERCK